MQKSERQLFEKRLYDYRKNKSNIALLEARLQRLDMQIYYNNVQSNENVRECIEGMSIHASVLSCTPRSITNEFRSIVEDVVMGYAREGVTHFNGEELHDEITRICKVLFMLRRDIDEIDRLLEALGDKQRFIIERYYIAKIKDHYEVSVMYSETFKKPIGEDRAKQLTFEAINEMMAIRKKITTPLAEN